MKIIDNNFYKLIFIGLITGIVASFIGGGAEKKYKYFYFHETLTNLINNDMLIRYYINKLDVSQKLSHSKGKNHPKINYSNISKQPLCYKRETTINHKEYYNYINNFFNI